MSYWLEIRCDRCKEEYHDDCADCLKKQEEMGFTVIMGETDVQIVYRPKGPKIVKCELESIIDVFILEDIE